RIRLAVFLFLSRSVIHYLVNDIPHPHIYSLSLHDALPISLRIAPKFRLEHVKAHMILRCPEKVPKPGQQKGPSIALGNFLRTPKDRKSTRLNSSHVEISYAVFCLKKKIVNQRNTNG